MHRINPIDHPICLARLLRPATLWEELKPRYAHFELLHGGGLGVLAVGDKQTEPMKALLSAPEVDSPSFRQFFFSVVESIEFELSASEISARQEANNAAIGHGSGRNAEPATSILG